MNVLLSLLLIASNWFYVPNESPPVEVEGVDLNLDNHEFAFTFFALSDGEAALLSLPTGEHVLINTGDGATKKELQALLKVFKVNQLNAILITRADLFEQDILSWLSDTYHVEHIYTNKKINESIRDQSKVEEWEQGTNKEIHKNVNIEVLFNGEGKNEGLDFLLTIGKKKILYLSSSSVAAEKGLLEHTFNGVDIVKIPAFAEEYAISSDLIKHLDPRITYIFHSSMLEDHPDTIRQLHDEWVHTYYADKHGTIILKFSGDNYEIISLTREPS